MEKEDTKENFEKIISKLKESRALTMKVTLDVLLKETDYTPSCYIKENPGEYADEIFTFMKKLKPQEFKSKVFAKVGDAVVKAINLSKNKK